MFLVFSLLSSSLSISRDLPHKWVLRGLRMPGSTKITRIIKARRAITEADNVTVDNTRPGSIRPDWLRSSSTNDGGSMLRGFFLVCLGSVCCLCVFV